MTENTKVKLITIQEIAKMADCHVESVRCWPSIYPDFPSPHSSRERPGNRPTALYLLDEVNYFLRLREKKLKNIPMQELDMKLATSFLTPHKAIAKEGL